MSHQNGTKPLALMTRWQIRRAAIGMAFYMWLMGVLAGPLYGKSIFQAVSSGGAGALVGLASWTFYHFASGRDDGLMFVFVGAHLCIMTKLGPFLPTVGIGLVSTVPCAWIAGLITRRYDAKDAVPETADPLFDAEIDRAAKPPDAG